MKYLLILFIVFILVGNFIGCFSSKKQDDKAKSEISISAEKEEKPVVKAPDTPVSVAAAIPMLEKWNKQTVSVSSNYVGSFGSGAILTLRLMDSPDSTEELECVFENNLESLHKINFGPLTISGTVWNRQLVNCKIINN